MYPRLMGNSLKRSRFKVDTATPVAFSGSRGHGFLTLFMHELFGTGWKACATKFLAT
jgi:hypothetical protein